ncbi:homoserine kinase [Microlunatus elymi]|uniref:Homoserine kinase n=1 Tax=Microlunatus elymi TaxID=2596828 RepID=A0A516Q0V3_9ACTN|nr:homoserine kinase [Microlunatus elymi]QDP97065.1 homoserine kinase [Microlunatus elymi]
MPSVLPAGRRVEVEVPATSANLGPGFDCLGLALDLYNSCSFSVVDEPTRVVVAGEGAGRLPTGRRNLIVRSLEFGLRRLGVEPAGVRVEAHNRIPGSRGLGSSSAAIVTGLIGAHGLARPDEPFDPADWLGPADEIEGHPDNVAAALYGDLVLAYRRVGGDRQVAASVAGVHPDIGALALIPPTPVGTEQARALLPKSVPHSDAAANAGRAGLLVRALTAAPELLFEATADWLHQSYRATAMPQSAALLDTLRGQQLPAVISGAGPTVLVLGTEAQLVDAEQAVSVEFRCLRLEVAAGARIVADKISRPDSDEA